MPYVFLHVYMFVLCACMDLKFINLQNSLSLQVFNHTCEASIAKRGVFVDTLFCTQLINFSPWSQ